MSHIPPPPQSLSSFLLCVPLSILLPPSLSLDPGLSSRPGSVSPHCALATPGAGTGLTALSATYPLLAVSIEDIQEVRKGHRTEGMEKFARDVPEDRCFSIVFKDQRNTLDLISPSPAEAQHWVRGLHKIIHHSGSMDQRQKLQQYPSGSSGSAQPAGAGCGHRQGSLGVEDTPLGPSYRQHRLGGLHSGNESSHSSGG